MTKQNVHSTVGTW